MNDKKEVPKYVDVISGIIATLVLIAIAVAIIAGIVLLVRWIAN